MAAGSVGIRLQSRRRVSRFCADFSARGGTPACPGPFGSCVGGGEVLLGKPGRFSGVRPSVIGAVPESKVGGVVVPDLGDGGTSW